SGYVLVGQSALGVESQLAGLRLLLLAGGLLSLVGAAAASWLVAGRALRPLEAMARTAADGCQKPNLTTRSGGCSKVSTRCSASSKTLTTDCSQPWGRSGASLR